ncbi:uncharacterized protein [Atheta coriaria]|uniref:uncharacterized protein n=1 Tax=Dalotia coriaria TaxID=877792 RepID=UPI0031F42405
MTLSQICKQYALNCFDILNTTFPSENSNKMGPDDESMNRKSSQNNDDPSGGDNNKSFDINETPELQFQPCFMCNGFYGPCYEDPICPMCHSFLLTNPNMTAHKIYKTCLPEEKDDEDSGNDEPVEDNDRSENSGNDSLVAMQENVDVPAKVVDIEQLPPEVMMLTLSYLDDLSMWAAALVNPRWRAIITRRVTTPDYWKNMVTTRWPLFEFCAGAQIKDWFEVYSSLTKSSCCIKCLRQIALHKVENEDYNHWRQRRLCNELKSLRMDPPDGIQAHPIDKQYCHWIASVRGPQGSPYEGGIFFLYLYISLDYPMIPPVVRFITRIYHPNISRHGDIGLDSIGNNWSLALTISKVLISIQSLLTDPVCEVCMEPKIGEIYATDRLRYDDTARKWTWRYAMTQLLPH